MNATQELDEIYATLDNDEPDSNVELANRYISKAEDMARQAINKYEDKCRWLAAKRNYRALKELEISANEAEKYFLGNAKELFSVVINGDCSCQPDGDACAYCRALNTMREYLGAI